MENNLDNAKVIAKVDKVIKQIDPNSKKQITELSENAEFRKTVEDIKSFVVNYEVKANFPIDVYDKMTELTEFCDKQYKELTEKKITLQKQGKSNVALAGILNEVYLFAITREDFSEYEKTLRMNGLEDYIDKLRLISQTDRKSEEYEVAEKAVKSKIQNLETNTHIDIDLDRIDDKEKVLSYISIELDNVLSQVNVSHEINVEFDEPEIRIAESFIEHYVPDRATYMEYANDSLIKVKTGILDRIANSSLMAKIKVWFSVGDTKALGAGNFNTKAE